jgi:hypothetical protein
MQKMPNVERSSSLPKTVDHLSPGAMPRSEVHGSVDCTASRSQLRSAFANSWLRSPDQEMKTFIG